MSDEKPKALSIEEIEADLRNKPKVNKPKMHRGFPIGCGSTGVSLGREEKLRSYDRDVPDDDTPNGETVGARISVTSRVK